MNNFNMWRKFCVWFYSELEMEMIRQGFSAEEEIEKMWTARLRYMKTGEKNVMFVQGSCCCKNTNNLVFDKIKKWETDFFHLNPRRYYISHCNTNSYWWFVPETNRKKKKNSLLDFQKQVENCRWTLRSLE